MGDAGKVLRLPLRSRPIIDRSQFANPQNFRQGYVYFAQAVISEERRVGSPIKIGWSLNPWTRVHEGNCWFPFGTLRALRVYRGTLQDERECHRMFKHLRIRGEWFEATPELCEYVDNLPAEVADAAKGT